MNVHEGHRKRLQNHFLQHGLETFEPVNVLELLLFFVYKRGDTNVLAHRLLDRFGSFSGVLDAPYDALLEVEGVGPATASLLKLAGQMPAVYLSDRAVVGEIITSTAAAGAFLTPRFVGCVNEEVHLVLLDDKNKVLRTAKLFEGTVNMTPITIKKVIAEVVATNATGVILAHNHPGGLALPSAQDKAATRELQKALSLINIRLVDHIIVADGDYVSMADSGMLR